MMIQIGLLLACIGLALSVGREKEQYFQEVSHRSVFLNFEATDEVQISTAWDSLPFEGLEIYRGSTASMMPEQNW